MKRFIIAAAAIVAASTLCPVAVHAESSAVYFRMICGGKPLLYSQSRTPQGILNAIDYNGVNYPTNGGTRRGINADGEVYVMQSAFNGNHVVSIGITKKDMRNNTASIVVDGSKLIPCIVTGREEW